MFQISHGDQQCKLNLGDMVVGKDCDGKLSLNEVRGGYGTLRENGMAFYNLPLVDIDAGKALAVENEMVDYNDHFIAAQETAVADDVAHVDKLPDYEYQRQYEEHYADCRANTREGI